jgi:ubiquinol-cytochrome c reductase cytochrome c subunit
MLRVTAIMMTLGLALASGTAAQAPAATPAAPAQSRAASTPSGNPEEGRKLFVSYGCYQCHGYEAQGSSATGPRLGPRPIAFAAFSRYVRQPAGQMPPYTTKVVSDADLANIYAFVQTRPAPPPVQNLQLLR